MRQIALTLAYLATAGCATATAYERISAAGDPIEIDGASARAVVSNASASCARLDDGGLACWPTAQLDTTPRRVSHWPPIEVLAAGETGVCGIDVSARVVCSGGPDVVTADVVVPELPRARALLGSLDAGCLVGQDSGHVLCWAPDGELPSQGVDGSARPRGRLVQLDESMPGRVWRVRGPRDVVEIAGGLIGACAREASGRVWCWTQTERSGIWRDTSARPERGVALMSRAAGSRQLAANSDGTAFCSVDASARTTYWSLLEGPIPLALGDVQMFALADRDPTLALLRDGELAVAGSSAFGLATRTRPAVELRSVHGGEQAWLIDVHGVVWAAEVERWLQVRLTRLVRIPGFGARVGGDD